MKYRHLLILLAAGGFAMGHFTKQDESGSALRDAGRSRAKVTDALLREGDPVKLREAMQSLAESDPGAFFKQLGRLPALDGLAALAASAGKKLSEGDSQEAVDILNRISNRDYRRVAWTEFVAGQERLSLSEKIALARKAEGVGSPVAFVAAIAPALAKDVDGTLKILRESNDSAGYYSALKEVSVSDPLKAIGKVAESLESGPLDQASCRSLLQEIISASANGSGMLKEIAGIVESRGWKGGVEFDQVFLSEFQRAAPDTKGEAMEGIEGLPAVRKNFVLSQLDLAGYPEPETRAMILNAMDSAELQRAALEKWKAAGASAADLTALSPLLKSAKTRADLAAMSGR